MTQTKMTQASAFIYFMCKLDIEMIDLILDDGITYQDLPKNLFINLLNDIIDDFLINGNTHLIEQVGFCKHGKCGPTKNGFLFCGNKNTDKTISFILQENVNGRITDIYECFNFKVLDFNQN
jgi:hypothetical protein